MEKKEKIHYIFFLFTFTFFWEAQNNFKTFTFSQYRKRGGSKTTAKKFLSR